jgi:predicted transcriptional regulator
MARRNYMLRQVQVVRILDSTFALSIRQLARKMKLTERTVYRYLNPLIQHGIVYVRFKANERGSKKPVYFYSTKRAV